MFFGKGAVGGLAGGQEEVYAEDCHFPSVEAFWSREPTAASSDVLPPRGRRRGLLPRRARTQPGRWPSAVCGRAPYTAPAERGGGRGAQGGAAGGSALPAHPPARAD